MRRSSARFLRRWIIPACVLVTAAAFLIYTGNYYHADSFAQGALEPDGAVSVTQTRRGWFFDGPSGDDALIFYPGAKVEETAYAPLLHLVAAEGMDVFLVKMPFHLAVFGKNRADDLIPEYDYDHWYIGGHSLGGAMAADYAAGHGSQLSGVILLAAYPTKPLDEGLTVTTIYGSGDGVLNMTRLEKSGKYLPEGSRTFVIEGGNHAQFGNYGEQDGDGEASISAEEQQRQAAQLIMRSLGA